MKKVALPYPAPVVVKGQRRAKRVRRLTGPPQRDGEWVSFVARLVPGVVAYRFSQPVAHLPMVERKKSV